MTQKPLDLWILRAILIVAFAYHGAWNLDQAGLNWWTLNQAQLPFPTWMRWPVGIAEIAFAVWILWGRFITLPLLGMCALMSGAVLSNFHNGYSYKNLGIEVPLAYLGIAIVLLIRGGFFDRIVKLLNTKVR